MENGDLKRYYKVNNQDAKDFARLNADGKIDKDLLPSDVGTTVVANPTGTATDDLTKIQVGETIYGIEGGTEVIANPTMAGTEAALNGLQVGDTKYKVDSGISQADADARYLKLAGGTMTGNIIFGSNNVNLRNSMNFNLIRDDGTYVSIGNNVRTIELASENANIIHTKNGTSYDMLDTSNGLALTGGTMTGDIKMSNNTSIKIANGDNMLYYGSGGTHVGTGQTWVSIETGSQYNVVHQKGSTSYEMLDVSNTSANPTLVGGETILTSLKLNGTNYAIAGGTQVTFVDWS